MAKYKFFRQSDGKFVETEEELWQWEAHYRNGQIFKQFDDQGLFHQFSEIDQNQLMLFKMISKKHPQTYSFSFSSTTMKLIHFYRNTILNAGTEDEKRIRYYCFGYEQKIGQVNYKLLFTITPNNELIVSNSTTNYNSR